MITTKLQKKREKLAAEISDFFSISQELNKKQTEILLEIFNFYNKEKYNTGFIELIQENCFNLQLINKDGELVNEFTINKWITDSIEKYIYLQYPRNEEEQKMFLLNEKLAQDYKKKGEKVKVYQEGIVYFGKYKDQPYENLLADIPYCSWLIQQDWFVKGHKHLFKLIEEKY